MRRRVFIVIGALLAVILVAALTMPFWFGALAGTVAPRYGVTFSDYRRLGYGRFALTDVTYRGAGVRATADRVELASPLNWAWRGLRSEGADVRVTKWEVALEDRPAASPTKGETPGPTGWMPVRDQVFEALNRLRPWLDHVELGPGKIQTPAANVSTEGVTWDGHTLALHGVAYQERMLEVQVTIAEDADEIRVTAAAKPEGARLSVTSRGADLTGELVWWEEPARFTARFPPTGWMPAEAEISATDWNVAAERLKLGELYAAVQGDARVVWRDERFTLEVTAKSTALTRPNPPPPMDVVLRARGDLQTITVEQLNAEMPGTEVRLSAPVTVTRTGEVRDGPARFTTTVDLAQLPWIEAAGTVTGRFEVTDRSPGATAPPAEFDFEARDVAAAGVSVQAVVARGRLVWPQLELSEATVTGTNGEQLRAHGGWDFKTKEVQDASVAGELRFETFARWLPKGVTFGSVRVEAAGSGAPAELRHRGNVQVAKFQAASLKPMDIVVDWNGTGQTVDRVEANVTAGESHLALTGAVDAESARLSAFEFAPAGASPLRLATPATLRWKPKLELQGFALSNEKSGIEAGGSWGETGSVRLAIREIPSSWLADFVELPGPTWTVGSVAVNARWDRGPLTFEAIAGGSALLQEGRDVAVNLSLRGDSQGVELVALRALHAGAAALFASGRAPLIITPGATPAWRIETGAPVALQLQTSEDREFWADVGRMAGVTLDAPELAATVTGTWEKPQGTFRARVDRVGFTPKAGKELPPIENVDLAMRGDRSGVTLERFALAVENQSIRASGHLPFPAGGWNELRREPLGYARAHAQLELEIPNAEIAAFENLLPSTVVPQGTVAAKISLHDGSLGGSVELKNAATRPIGSLGALHEIGATATLDGDVVRIESISAELGGAPVRLSGTIALPPWQGGASETSDAQGWPRFDLAAKATNVPLVRKVGTLVRADMDVALTSPRDAPPLIHGTVRLRDSLFLQDVRGLIPSGTKSKSERPPFFAVEIDPFSAWRLDVQVTGHEFLRLRTTLFNGTTSADFRLGGTLGEPTLLGEATIDRGQVRLPFATFTVTEGRVALTPAQPHEPQIELTAKTRRFEYDLTMQVTGGASDPAVNFESTPPLERAQVLLMVMAGVVPDNAVSLTQQQRATRIGSYLGQSLLSSLGGGDDTSRLTITSGEDISEKGQETYRIEYSLGKRWSLTAEYDEYDTQTFGFKWQALRRGGVPLASSATDSSDAGAGTPDGATGAGAPTGGGAGPDSADGEKKLKPARLDVTGLGWFGNFEMETSLKRLLGSERGAVLDSPAVEDALFLLMSAIREKGYLRPTIGVRVVEENGGVREMTVDADLVTAIPRGLRARAVEFDVDRGTHYFVADLQIEGLNAIERDAAAAYFARDAGIFQRESARAFTPDRLKRGLSSLEAALRERGYPNAKVEAAEPQIDHATGEVAVKIDVTEGPQWQIAAVDVEGAVPGLARGEGMEQYTGKPWTESTEQDIAAEVRKHHLVEGYADARVEMEHRVRPGETDPKAIDVIARVTPGKRIEVGEIRFTGEVKTQESVLEEKVPFKPGDPLNPLAVETARHRIQRLGVFQSVDVQTEPADGPVRDLVFEVTPGRRMELNLLAGYNTYEGLRGGVEVRRYNVWGRAHRTRGLLVQSMKSTKGEYSYTVPQLFGEDVQGTARFSGLHREEVAFLRQEYGVDVMVDLPLRILGANLTAGYSFQVLRNRNNQLETNAVDRGQVPVASLQLGLTRDSRDNPLLPRDGYRWFSRTEIASQALGGQAEYQRLEFGGSYHRPQGAGRWLHFAAAHGVVATLGQEYDQLPVNKRFFPGGDGSIRGYQVGEAAPRGPDGRFVGAASYMNATVEFEQTLADKWSAVAFVDALGSARRLGRYPFEEVLVAAGLGIHYQTLIGPIRAEYGFNLNRRTGDPRGTFLLSIGYPF